LSSAFCFFATIEFFNFFTAFFCCFATANENGRRRFALRLARFVCRAECRFAAIAFDRRNRNRRICRPVSRFETKKPPERRFFPVVLLRPQMPGLRVY
jgi:hypothetical protein